MYKIQCPQRILLYYTEVGPPVVYLPIPIPTCRSEKKKKQYILADCCAPPKDINYLYKNNQSSQPRHPITCKHTEKDKLMPQREPAQSLSLCKEMRRLHCSATCELQS